jgi:hypothetical protein
MLRHNKCIFCDSSPRYLIERNSDLCEEKKHRYKMLHKTQKTLKRLVAKRDPNLRTTCRERQMLDENIIRQLFKQGYTRG